MAKRVKVSEVVLSKEMFGMITTPQLKLYPNRFFANNQHQIEVKYKMNLYFYTNLVSLGNNTVVIGIGLNDKVHQ